MTQTVSVRRAVLDDLEAVARMFEAYRTFYRVAPAPDRVTGFLADRLRNQDSAIFLAALSEGAPAVGFTQLYPMFSSVSVGRSFVLNDLYVDPSARGRGVGRALLERAASFGRETGALYLELATEMTNTAAQRLYDGAGWQRDTEFYHYALDLR